MILDSWKSRIKQKSLFSMQPPRSSLQRWNFLFTIFKEAVLASNYSAFPKQLWADPLEPNGLHYTPSRISAIHNSSSIQHPHRRFWTELLEPTRTVSVRTIAWPPPISGCLNTNKKLRIHCRNSGCKFSSKTAGLAGINRTKIRKKWK